MASENPAAAEKGIIWQSNQGGLSDEVVYSHDGLVFLGWNALIKLSEECWIGNKFFMAELLDYPVFLCDDMVEFIKYALLCY